MQKVFTLFALGINVLFANSIFAGNPANVTQLLNHRDWNFIENKGQLADENGKFLSDIKFYGHSLCNGGGSIDLYCKPGGLSFVFTKTRDNAGYVSEATAKPVFLPGAGNSIESKVTACRADMILVGANKDAQVIALDQKPYYENFYSANTPENGILNVRTYKTIIYKNIYPNIDMVLHTKADAMKYEFVVHPGGEVGQIQIRWDGVENMVLAQSGGITYALASGIMEEGKPVSFQGQDIVKSSFVRIHSGKTESSNNIGFAVSHYNKSKDLVIDPTLSWGTYYGGGAGTNQLWSVTTDISGNVYISGSTASTTGIATTGAYQSTYGGGTDAVLAKFSSTGSILWSTYYGLKGSETAHSVTTDHSGNVFITGATTSQATIATSGAYLTKNTAKEAFLVQFTSAGARNWGTYFGGGAESSVDAATDTAGNVYLLGETTSKTGIASSGAYQTSIGGGDDLFLAKFSNNGTYQWSTYFGGSGTEVPGYLVTDIAGNVYINASSTSTTGLATSGAYQTSMAGGSLEGDALIAKFSSSGSRVWCTYYGGSNDDQGTGIAIDTQSNLYITGNTASSSGISTSGAWQTALGGATDAFLAKFNKNGALEWGTYYGGSDVDAGTWVATDPNSNAYITGGTQSTSGIATSGAYQTNVLNGSSLFLSRFTTNGSLVWATYYGSSDVSTTFSVATSGYTNVYACANTVTNSGIATSGAYQTSLLGTEDGYLINFNFNYNNDAGITSIKTPGSIACAGSDSVKVMLKNYGNAELDSVKIFWTINGKVQNTYNWKGNLKYDSSALVTISNFDFAAGLDTIKVWTSLPNGITDSVPINDSAKIVTLINPAPPANTGKNVQLCFESTVDTIGAAAISGDTYNWTSDPSGFISTSSSAVVAPGATSVYRLTETITATGCSKTDSVTITVNALPKANAGSNGTVCYGNQVSLGSAAVTGSTYSWVSSPAGYSSTIANPTVSDTTATIYILTETNNLGCSKTDSVSVSVNPLPAANAGVSSTICAGNSVSLGTSAVSGSTYNWTSLPAGFSSTSSSPSVIPAGTTTYFLTETSVLGCSKTDSVVLTVNPLPAANTGSGSTACSGAPVFLGATAVLGDTYLWSSFPTGFSSTVANPIVNPTITTTYYLTESIPATGCSKEDSVKVKVNPLPAANAGLSTSICLDLPAIIGDTAILGDTYLWSSLPAGFSSTAANPTVTPTVTTTYYLSESITATGCTKKDSVLITVNPLPASGVIKDTIVCSQSTLSIGSTAVNGNTYSWTSSPIGFTSTASNPAVNPTGTTSYMLTETNSFNCSKTYFVTVTTKPLPDAHFTLTYLGDTAILTAIDSSFVDSSYVWILGDGTTATGHKVLHVYAHDIQYAVLMALSDTNGCRNANDSSINIEFSGIETDLTNKYSIGLYPNPFHSSITIKYSILKPEKTTITLYDVTGKPIGVIEDKYLSTGNYETEINTEKYNLSPGVYMLRFTTEEGSVSKQMVKF